MLPIRHNLEGVIQVDIRTESPGPLKFFRFTRRWTPVYSVVI